jgi:hypothetical protein
MTSPSMNYTWKVTATGSFRIVIGYAGNDNYNEAVASLLMKTV